MCGLPFQASAHLWPSREPPSTKTTQQHHEQHLVADKTSHAFRARLINGRWQQRVGLGTGRALGEHLKGKCEPCSSVHAVVGVTRAVVNNADLSGVRIVLYTLTIVAAAT